MREDILEIVRREWPSDSRRVGDWPEDERIIFREARDTKGLEYAYVLLEQYRQQKMAYAITERIENNMLDYL